MLHLIPSLASTTAALDAESTRLEIISQNIANANTTRGPDGHPYQRQQVVFESVLEQAKAASGSAEALLAPRVATIRKDPRPGPVLYQPGHPDADASGMVQFPNVNIYEEMADMIVASRTYEANLAVLKNGRAMALQALAIGKH
jgi:flagellar basal-body rod protein FlgC